MTRVRVDKLPGPGPFVLAYREACRRAGASGAWTWRMSPAARIALVHLAEVDEPIGGAELARRAGLDQANTTSITLPRLDQLGLVDWTIGEPACHGAKLPRVWWLTETGAHLAALAAETGETTR